MPALCSSLPSVNVLVLPAPIPWSSSVSTPLMTVRRCNGLRTEVGNAICYHQSHLTAALKDDTQLVKMFFDNPGFKKWLMDKVFQLVSKAG